MTARQAPRAKIAKLLTLGGVSVVLFAFQHHILAKNVATNNDPSNTLRRKSKIVEQTTINEVFGDPIFQPQQNATKHLIPDAIAAEPQYHIVFSTGCSEQQHWEAMVFFYHAHKVQQPGTVTRIVSGCSTKEQQTQLDFFRTSIRPMHKNFFIHFTPSFGDVQKAKGQNYKYMNKPFGLLHWMEHGELGMVHNQITVSKYDDDIVILMDPDMVLLRPITHDFSDVENHIWVEENVPPLSRQFVRHSHPMAQQDGYLGNKWMELNVSHILGEKDHANTTIPKDRDGPIHWNAGPPYLATVRDMYQIAQKWTEYAPRVVQVHPELFAEMYGFIFATVHLKLPFTLVRSLAVSSTVSGLFTFPFQDREGWPHVDALSEQQLCDLPRNYSKLPIVVHYCQRYWYGEMFFSKYRLKKNIMDCDKPLLQPPPLSSSFVGRFNYSIVPPPADGLNVKPYKRVHRPILGGRRTADREAFMLCAIIGAVNEALEHHKNLTCAPGTANLNRTYSVYNDPTDY